MPFASAIRAMIVDDQLTSRALIRDGLQQLGIENIEMAADGEQALKSLMQKPAHLVISDLNMPKLDGLQFLQAGAGASCDAKVRLHHADRARRPRVDRARHQARRQQLPRQAFHDSCVEGCNRSRFREAEMSGGPAAIAADISEEARYRKVHIVQGEYFVSDDPDVVLVTLLGSCVSACIRDPVARVGGITIFCCPATIKRREMARPNVMASISWSFWSTAFCGAAPAGNGSRPSSSAAHGRWRPSPTSAKRTSPSPNDF